MHLLLGTTNKGKIIEMREVLSGLDITILTPDDKGIAGSPQETGSTFAENAMQKALLYHQQSGLPVVADDSGIIVEALKDELGIHTRRWGAGPDASDQEWIEFFLRRMKDERNRKACFLCSLAYIDADGTEQFFEGRCDGTITESLEAAYLRGLPISACFRPEGYGKVFSALSLTDKNRVSHRGKAVSGFRSWLETRIEH